MKPNLIKIEKLLKSKKTILVNNKLIKRILGFDDMRDLSKSISDWGYCTDFTYRTEEYDWQRFIRRWLKEEYFPDGFPEKYDRYGKDWEDPRERN